MELPPDFRDLIFEFNAAGVEYLLVGDYAMGAHGMPRYTGDIDLFFRATVDLLNAISGASFDDAWRSRVVKEIGGVDVPLIGLDQLIANKAASGRLKNQADLETLRRNDANKK